MRVSDTTAGFAEYGASTPLADAFLVRPFAASTDVFGLLGNAVLNNFDNTTLPTSNFDFTGAYQWNLVVPASGTSSVTVQLTGNTNLPPVTAASVSVGGRVMTAKGGSGVGGATVSLTDQFGTVRTVRTNPFGYFRFDEIPTGDNYVFTIEHKLYGFSPRVVTIIEDVSEIIFVPDSE